jgi:general stress protein 26
MNFEEMKRNSLELIEKSKAVYLTTIDPNGRPMTRAMLNLRNLEQFPEYKNFFEKQQNKFSIYFSTNTSSSKVKHIKKNPAICVYFCDPEDFHGLMLAGDGELLYDKDLREALWLEGGEKYYPEGIDDPDYTVLRLVPNYGRYYYHLDKLDFRLGEKK